VRCHTFDSRRDLETQRRISTKSVTENDRRRRADAERDDAMAVQASPRSAKHARGVRQILPKDVEMHDGGVAGNLGDRREPEREHANGPRPRGAAAHEQRPHLCTYSFERGGIQVLQQIVGAPSFALQPVIGSIRSARMVGGTLRQRHHDRQGDGTASVSASAGWTPASRASIRSPRGVGQAMPGTTPAHRQQQAGPSTIDRMSPACAQRDTHADFLFALGHRERQ